MLIGAININPIILKKQQLLHYYLTFQDREGKKDLPSLSFPISSDVLRRYHSAP